MLQSWLGVERAATLVVLTHGGVGLAGEDITDLAAAAVWGLVRSAQSEHPGRIVLIDTDTPPRQAAAPRLTGADESTPVDGAAGGGVGDLGVLAGLGEPQLLVRGGRVYGARLAPAPPVLGLPVGESAWRLAVGGAGTLQDVVAQPCPQVLEPLGAGQVRVAVRAAG